MSVELIYKTTSPKAIEWWKHAEAAVLADGERRMDYERQMTEEFGPPDLPDYYKEDRRSRRCLWLRGARPIGLDSGSSEQPPAGSGWRLDSKERFWMPKLATKEGKARAAELRALCTYDVREHLREVGVAPMAFADLALYHPGLEFDEEESALYVTWGSGWCASEAVAAQAKVPEIEWVEVKRSEWYAREEAKSSHGATVGKVE